jgi:hypothetical protein
MPPKLSADSGLNGHDCPGIAGVVARASVKRLFVKGFAGPDREIR